MLYGLGGLWHNTIVGCDYKNDHICHIGAARPHSGKSLVSRRVKECNFFAVQFDLIRADMLSNSARFAVSYLGRPYPVEQAGFAVVNVSKHCYHR